MADKMTQNEVDALIASMGNQKPEEKSNKKPHILICKYCKQLYFPASPDMHYYLTTTRCWKSKYGHTYVSKKWLLDKKKKAGTI